MFAGVPDIVLSTLNAKYIHAAFGLRCLFANLGELQPRARIVEFEIKQRPIEVAERLLALEPRIVGMGVYIWNVSLIAEVVSILKRVRPELTVILGGPEVSFPAGPRRITELADYVITGEADLKFAEVCGAILAGDPPTEKIIPSGLPELQRLQSPYQFYTEDDIAHRILYVEASRGCPFSCEFCLSSLDVPVRQFALEPFLADLESLLERGVRQFKFVDRTFNLNLNVSSAILEFFLARQRPGLFAHFEMVPDRLPESLRALIAKFPPGALQFEVGIQTFNEEVAKQISRRQNYERLEDNFRYLKAHTGVHIHADLIAGLPGETMESFGDGFDRLVGLGPQEIQVGILKRLHGTPISRHDAEWGMVYSEDPPYEILRNRVIDFPDMQRLRRFARFWDLVGNSGNFLKSAPLLWADGRSPFGSFLAFSDWLYQQTRRTDSIALGTLSELLFRYLTEQTGQEKVATAALLLEDYRRGGRRETPEYLREFVGSGDLGGRLGGSLALPRRQGRHVDPTC